MSHVATAPHECEGNLIFTANGLNPYWTIADMLINRFDGDGEITTELDEEQWTISLTYQKGGIAPRSHDDVSGDRLYEYRIHADGRGERKASFLIQPRFTEMYNYETGERIETPFDHIDAKEGVNVRFSGSNLDPDEYQRLLPQFAQALAQAAGTYLDPNYLAGAPHEMSNITTYERYVRLRRSMSPKVVGETGIMHRLFHLCAQENGSRVEYKADNQEIVGYNHRVVLPKQDVQRLFGHHQAGKQLKHYHPKHVRGADESDPLYHPKVGVLAKKSLSSGAFDWSERRELRHEIDELLINALHWSDVPTQADPTTFVADEHFAVTDAADPVSRHSDPTPEMEANQEALLVTALRDLTDSDIELLESLVTDGGTKHTTDIEDETGRGLSTIYRSLKRLRGLVENDNGEVSFSSKKIEQEIAGIVERTEQHIENAANRVGALYNLDVRQSASSAWDKWCQKYAARVVDETRRGNPVVRIDTMLSKLKSTSAPRIQDVLAKALKAWHKDGRDVTALRNGLVRWTDRNGDQREWRVRTALD